MAQATDRAHGLHLHGCRASRDGRHERIRHLELAVRHRHRDRAGRFRHRRHHMGVRRRIRWLPVQRRQHRREPSARRRRQQRQGDRRLPLRARRQPRDRGQVLRRQRARIYSQKRTDPRLGGAGQRRLGRQAVATQVGARGQATDGREPHHLHDGLRLLAGRRHGDRIKLRHLDRPVRHEHGHRLPDCAVEYRRPRRGHAPVHVQRQSQRLVWTTRPEQVPWRPRGMAQVREP